MWWLQVFKKLKWKNPTYNSCGQQREHQHWPFLQNPVTWTLLVRLRQYSASYRLCLNHIKSCVLMDIKICDWNLSAHTLSTQVTHLYTNAHTKFWNPAAFFPRKQKQILARNPAILIPGIQPEHSWRHVATTYVYFSTYFVAPLFKSIHTIRHEQFISYCLTQILLFDMQWAFKITVITTCIVTFTVTNCISMFMCCIHILQQWRPTEKGNVKAMTCFQRPSLLDG